MHWFKVTAPIRAKLFSAFGLLTSLTALLGVTGFIVNGLHPVMIVATLACTLAAVFASMWFRAAIADPYVATVVRMEGLAAGDLDGKIDFTEYQDCVGRLSRGMLIFRDNAVAQQRDARSQADVVATLAEQLSRVASGDLTAKVTTDFPPAYADLKANYNDALDSLCKLIGSVGESATTIRTGTGEIAQASEDLARRTEGNAASLEQTSAALTQIDSRLKTSADASSSTVKRADQAILTVSGGRQIADEAVQAMTRVSDSAKGIDGVIEGLDKIAFQTRVLAMNAAVEAGRAGDAGRGFAVVADLVSALAMRAEEEAKRARDQLSVTQAEISSAVGAVQQVDGALQNIAGDVGEVHNLLSSMARDNMAQASAISQITAAVGAMDQATQQNAAMVEETSAAARNLTSEVQALTEQTATFNVDASGPARNPAPRHFSPQPDRRSAAPREIKRANLAGAGASAGGDDWQTF